jgi:hypothetical protein
LLLCWRDGNDFGGKSLFSFSSGGRNSFEHLLLTSSSNFYSASVWADNYKMPAQQQAGSVVSNPFDNL